ncbi:HAD-IIIC family phosphatase [Gammaproteobacteria bacterium]|nr:HAD-IIIC family phosphatase [Gammaproteobacteria bacterium]
MKKAPKKVIVTDLDHTFWHGILGEVGPTNINASQNGSGYIHFIYQTFLKRLKDSGILLCIVSKNDDDLVKEAFKSNEFALGYEEFVSISASYNPKSSKIREISESINIGLSDFVFIDDNPIEIEEVQSILDEVICISFPSETNAFPIFLDQLHAIFSLNNITEEDADRTELYKRMKQSSFQSSNKASDITGFLKSLSMEMTIEEKNSENNQRAVQLINKTNQFNLNGIRRSKEDCDELISNGARLISASLKDKNGDHGEVIVILIDDNSRALSYVMSCRIFQRKAEYAFLFQIFKMGIQKLFLDYKETQRNEPFRMFLSDFYDEIEDKKYLFNEKKLSAVSQDSTELFKIVEN